MLTVQLLNRKTNTVREIAVNPMLSEAEMIEYASRYLGQNEEVNGIYRWT